MPPSTDLQSPAPSRPGTTPPRRVHRHGGRDGAGPLRATRHPTPPGSAPPTAGGTGGPSDDTAQSTGLARAYHVFDNNGEVIGSFTDWDSAHAFAHATVTQPHAAAPLEVDDRQRRLTRRVWRHRCEFVTWRAARRVTDHHNHCDHPPA